MSRQKSFLFHETKLLFAILTSFTWLSSSFYPFINPVAQSTEDFGAVSSQMVKLPRIYDINLKADIVFRGLDFPTSIAFLGPNDILVLEKNTGLVKRIMNGILLPGSLLDVNVSKQSERGMLGIAVEKNENKEGEPTRTDVFLYFTEAIADEDKDNQTLGNSLYKYQFIENELINPKKLLDLPSSPGPAHDGGRVKLGPDNTV